MNFDVILLSAKIKLSKYLLHVVLNYPRIINTLKGVGKYYSPIHCGLKLIGIMDSLYL